MWVIWWDKADTHSRTLIIITCCINIPLFCIYYKNVGETCTVYRWIIYYIFYMDLCLLYPQRISLSMLISVCRCSGAHNIVLFIITTNQIHGHSLYDYGRRLLLSSSLAYTHHHHHHRDRIASTFTLFYVVRPNSTQRLDLPLLLLLLSLLLDYHISGRHLKRSPRPIEQF